MKRMGEHAVVIGASMGGLLAVRVLSSYFDTVTIVERDTLPASVSQRKGVPQGRHAHGLHARGREILEQLFPGLSDDLVAQGALRLDISNEFRWHAGGCFHQPCRSGLMGLLVSRPCLEAYVRSRTFALPNVRTEQGRAVLSLISTEDRSRITGVRFGHHGDETETVLEADLIVDAGGRGSRSGASLSELGYSEPEEERVQIDLTYTTCEFRRSPGQFNNLGGVAIAAEPSVPRAAAMLAQEDNRWIVTLGGYLGERSSLDLAGFLEYAKTLPTSCVYDVIKESEPLTAPIVYTFPASLRRRYERLSRFPAGYLVFGDAICSFNPVYGQGMTVAANEAVVLQECLDGGLDQIGPRFFKQASALIDAPWSVAVGTDLSIPGVGGQRTPMVRFVNWYIAKLHNAARLDSTLSVAFLRVVNMIELPPSLLHPRMAWRVLRGNMARRTPSRTDIVPIPVPSHI